MKNITDTLAMMTFRHNDLLERAGRFDALLESNNFEEIEHSFATLSEFFKADLRRHFEVEEKVFFPAALAGAPSMATSRLVLGLQFDHGQIVEAVSHITDTQESLPAVKRIFAILKEHALTEDHSLYPLFERNAVCRATAEDLLADFHSLKSAE